MLFICSFMVSSVDQYQSTGMTHSILIVGWYWYCVCKCKCHCFTQHSFSGIKWDKVCLSFYWLNRPRQDNFLIISHPSISLASMGKMREGKRRSISRRCPLKYKDCPPDFTYQSWEGDQTLKGEKMEREDALIRALTTTKSLQSWSKWHISVSFTYNYASLDFINLSQLPMVTTI